RRPGSAAPHEGVGVAWTDDRGQIVYERIRPARTRLLKQLLAQIRKTPLAIEALEVACAMLPAKELAAISRDYAPCRGRGLCDVHVRAQSLRRHPRQHVCSGGRIRCCTTHLARSRPADRRHGIPHNACSNASRV